MEINWAETSPTGEIKLMTGIQYVTDERGRKVAVQIDLKNIENYGKTLRMCLSPDHDGMKSGSRSTK
jgi:hypothetical protein